LSGTYISPAIETLQIFVVVDDDDDDDDDKCKKT